MGAVKATLGRLIKGALAALRAVEGAASVIRSIVGTRPMVLPIEGARPVTWPLGRALAPRALRWAVVVGAAGIAGATWRRAAVIAPGRWAVAIGALGRAVCGVALLGAVAATLGAVGALSILPAVTSVLRTVRAPVIAAAVSVPIGRACGFAVADRNVGKWRVGGLLGLGGVGVALFAHRAAGGSLDVAVRSHGEPVFS